MKIQIKNLGALRQVELELSDLTIICGRNNTGKTYATYALYGFLDFWNSGFFLPVDDHYISQLLHEGGVEIDLETYIKNTKNILKQACKDFTEQLSTVFASSEKHFLHSDFKVFLDLENIKANSSFNKTLRTTEKQLLSISKKAEERNAFISLIVEKEGVKIPREIIKRIIGDALKDIIFGEILPRPFIASAERTGAAIFRKELNFARNRLLEQMSSSEKDFHPLDLLAKVYSDYALPVKRNVDFTRQLEEIAKIDSFIAKEHSAVLADFANIIGGKYLVSRNDELWYVPNTNKQIKLSMDESSSAVRSLLDIGFYLRHVAAPGDLLMIDEPELNLHPENQRRVARLLASLVNLGIKIFITTHSDYIIKELNTLIMLNQENQYLKDLAKREGIKTNQLLSADKVKVYIAEECLIKLDGATRKTKCNTLTIADISPEYGIEAQSFDKTIEDMNRIQEEIVWGKEPSAN